MKTASVYTRVSTDNQEAEGTSLQTQLEACLSYCRGKDYDARYRYSEVYSGLSLERPELDKLRELVRSEQIDVLVVYSLDRFTRDPGHGVILTQELEKHGVKLEAVTEDVDNSELGKLISYIRGFASKLEAEKIRERTMRGRRARTKEGRMAGGFLKTYGYDYVKTSLENGGRRTINETEARWVKQIFQWLVEDGVSTTSITQRLRALNAPSKSGGMWNRSSVFAILKNPAYCGKTFAFTDDYKKPREEWIEIPGVTPAIISEGMFEAAQNQLRVNGQRSKRNTKRQYLLSSHLYCRRCGRAYRACIHTHQGKTKRVEARRYRCSGSERIVSPIDHCTNRGWLADKLEDIVWAQVQRVLDDPDLIIKEIGRQRNDVNQLGVLESELEQVERRLKAIDRDQAQLLQWALKGFPEDQVVAENKKLNTGRQTLQTRKTELEAQINASRETALSLPNLERFVDLVRQKLTSLDFETKRQVLDMLSVKVWLDGCNVEVTGILPVAADAVVSKQS